MGAAVALLLLSAAFPRVAAGTTAPEVPGAALPAFEEAAPMELYHSQLMDAHLVAELGRLGAEFQHNYSRLGFENTGYSYGSLRRLALQLEMLPSHEGRQADAPDAGQCSSLPSAMKAVSTAVDVASSDTQARWQRVQQELQLHLMSNCTLAEKVPPSGSDAAMHSGRAQCTSYRVFNTPQNDGSTDLLLRFSFVF